MKRLLVLSAALLIAGCYLGSGIKGVAAALVIIAMFIFVGVVVKNV